MSIIIEKFILCKKAPDRRSTTRYISFVATGASMVSVHYYKEGETPALGEGYTYGKEKATDLWNRQVLRGFDRVA